MPTSPTSAAAPTVSIFGGGVGGLSVAQELLERGFRVSIYEKQHWGGKIRGMPVPGSGTGGRADLPGQHGFHFFPGFYRNLPDLMARIPSIGGKSVLEHLVWGDYELLARITGQGLPATIPAHLSLSLKWVISSVRALMALQSGIPLRELLFFACRAVAFASTCRQRRVTDFDDLSWWDYVAAENMSIEYQRLVATLPASLLIAVLPRAASTRTLGDSMISMLTYGLRIGTTIDRVLAGPEQEYWVQPWVDHVAKLGGELHMPGELRSFQFDGRRVTGATVLDGVTERQVVSDYYVSALPLHMARAMLTPLMLRAAPSLARIGSSTPGG